MQLLNRPQKPVRKLLKKHVKCIGTPHCRISIDSVLAYFPTDISSKHILIESESEISLYHFVDEDQKLFDLRILEYKQRLSFYNKWRKINKIEIANEKLKIKNAEIAKLKKQRSKINRQISKLEKK